MPYKAFSINGVGDVTIYKRKSNRSIRLTVEANGGIRVTMPVWVPYKAGVAFATARRAWILAQSQRQLSGGLLHQGQWIGKSHRLIFRHNSAAHAIKTSVLGTEIIITYGSGFTVADKEVQTAAQTACLRALRVQAVSLLLPRLRLLSDRIGLTYRNAAIKRLKSRWGSCDQNTNIVLNVYLVQLPWECIDYVIFHELAHTKVLHHGPDFWKTLESLCPNARILRKRMKMFRPALLDVN